MLPIEAKVKTRDEYNTNLALAQEYAGPLLSELTYCQLEDIANLAKTFEGPRAEPLIERIEWLMTAITADEWDDFDDGEGE